MNQNSYVFISIILTCLLVVSCGNDESAYQYAQKFCSCSTDFSKAAIQLKAGTIDQAAFNKIEVDHTDCIGEKDPLKALKDKPQELEQFKMEFLSELEKQCPEIARNLNF